MQTKLSSLASDLLKNKSKTQLYRLVVNVTHLEISLLLCDFFLLIDNGVFLLNDINKTQLRD